MTELRKDFLSGEWVAISTARASRPFGFGGNACPFCVGNEHLTPPETYRRGYVRAFPNKYPALVTVSPEGYGIHEVLVDTETHEGRFADLPAEGIAEVFLGIQARMEALSGDERIKYVQAFKNHGRSGGASLEHSHWQILAIPVVPPRQRQIRRNFEEYLQSHGSCYLCDRQEQRVVFENAGAVAYVPEASLYSDGVCIMPRRHVSDFCGLTPVENLALAEALRRVLTAALTLHPQAGYNIFIQNGTSPANHVYIQTIPRLGNLAGFELATGCFINSIDPEETVSRFKDCIKAQV